MILQSFSMEDETKINNDQKKTKIVVLIALVAVVLLIVFFALFKLQEKRASGSTIKTFYSNIIELPNGSIETLKYPIETSVFHTSEFSKGELIDFYSNKLYKDGWTILSSGGSRDLKGAYSIYAEHHKNSSSISIVIKPQTNNNITVMLSYSRELLSKKFPVLYNYKAT